MNGPDNGARCQLLLSAECTEPEVLLDCPPKLVGARACIPCGKAFQQKFGAAAHGITLRPITNGNQI